MPGRKGESCLAEKGKVLCGCDSLALRGHNVMIRHDHLRKNLPGNFIRGFYERSTPRLTQIRHTERDKERQKEIKRDREKDREKKKNKGIPMKLNLATMDLARSFEQPAFHDSGVTSSVAMMFRSLNFRPISHAHTNAV
jgi:hypothetical protein